MSVETTSLRGKTILITGANGEIGHGLIEQLSQHPDQPTVVALDLHGLDAAIEQRVSRAVTGNILDVDPLRQLFSDYQFDVVFHLAALLSSHAEANPDLAQQVNVQGTINPLKLALEQSSAEPVKFIFPSSVAVYGLPDLATKQQADAVREGQYLQPATIYGCNKLYCEYLGHYYAERQQRLAPAQSARLDFRCLRFPGIISAYTVPSGGTSDFAPEMLHAAARHLPYTSFVRADTRIPFMVMPDAIQALLTLALADRGVLRQTVYNVASFSLSAGDVAERVRAAFPDAQISFAPDALRQSIVDSWPASLNDAAARRDWGWQPSYDTDRAFAEYLIPLIGSAVT